MLDVEIDDRKLKKALRIAPMRLKKELFDELDHISRSFLSRFRKERLKGPPGVYGDGKRGLLGTFKKTRFGVAQNVSALDMGVEIVSSSSVAVRHQHGETVRPSAREYLYIPFKANSRARALMFTKSKKKPQLKTKYRKLKNLSKNKGNKPFIMTVKGKEYVAQKHGDKPVLMYIRKKEAPFDESLHFYETWNKQRQKTITYLNRAVQKALDKV